MAKYRILSLDGGGIRGIVTAIILQRLNTSPGLAGWLDSVDLIAGTSTGGILALALANGLSPEVMRTLYETKGKKIFGSAKTSRPIPAHEVPAMNAPTAGSLGAFADLGLAPAVTAVLADVGYESPSPIQSATIPVILAGHDLLGQAQTGTGKTAAFALPLLSMIDIARREPQVLVLVPTRELAIQVAEAFQKYAGRLPGFHVLPIYGGQRYTPQLNALKRGTHVVVGTPGRVIDHLERRTLSLDTLTPIGETTKET